MSSEAAGPFDSSQAVCVIVRATLVGESGGDDHQVLSGRVGLARWLVRG
jgi:hypothetical protein